MFPASIQSPTKPIVGAALLAALLGLGGREAMGQDTPAPEDRSVAFLAVHVPRWHRENHCFSCHNNGDAARALIRARARGLLADDEPLDDTLAFLAKPEQWDANGPEGPFKDRELARIQFAAALTDAIEAGVLTDRDALRRGAQMVAEIQESDGGWPSDAPGAVGSPATYGRPLATWLAMRTLRASDPDKHAAPIAKGIAWFEGRPPQGVLDAAAALLALAEITSPAAVSRRQQAAALLSSAQSAEGGFGPFATAPPEVFDTAIVLLALSAQKDRASFSRSIAQGRAFLLAQQLPDGSWPPTTRPRGVDSYEQQMSTTAWATLALLATEPRPD